MKKNWLAVASAEHVRLGREKGFMQVCHGKSAPLRRIKPNDHVVYYSPTVIYKGKEKCQSFTAVGIATGNEPYQVDMGNGFCPFRLNMVWFKSNETPIAPLLHVLNFTSGVKNWGYQLRFGLFTISEHDMDIISQAMGVP